VEHLQDSKTRQDIISTIEKFYANSVAPALHREESPFQNYIADFAIDTTGKCMSCFEFESSFEKENRVMKANKNLCKVSSPIDFCCIRTKSVQKQKYDHDETWLATIFLFLYEFFA